MIYTILSFLVLVVAYVWVFSPLGTGDRVGITTAISMVALVILTSIYAWHTRKMAEEMKTQRYTENLPLLTPDIIRLISEGLAPNEIAYESLASGLGIKVVWRNVGKGVAINSRFSLWGKPLSSGKVPFIQEPKSYVLAKEEKKEVHVGGWAQGRQKEIDLWDEQQFDKPEGYHPHLLAEYQDIYERKITTVQEFRIDEENKRAFLEELYFTINGRRLGEE